MKINNLLKMFVGALMMTVIISSCADDFTEEDLLQAQYDLAQQQQDRADSREDSLRAQNVAALNQAGELVSFQLTAVDLDGTPVEGATVNMIAASEGGAADNQELSTDASGTVFFDRVPIGANRVTISGAGVLATTLTIDFGNIQEGVHYQIVDGVIVPTPVTETAVVTVIGENAATATVSGRVTIETDLTNLESEVPQDLTIRTRLNSGLTSSSPGINLQRC